MLDTSTRPHAEGMLAVGDGHRLHWTLSGNPAGLPALLIHGGPGSGASAGWLTYLDPLRYRIVAFDQRGCGSSTPHASTRMHHLATNTTAHLVADIELLRQQLAVERWLVLGGSWGATLGLAYAQAFPARVTALVLFAVATTTAREVQWITREMGRVFPREWEAFRAGVRPEDRDGDLATAYARLLADPDPAVCAEAASRWCAWEDVHVSLAPGHTPDPRYADERFRLAFARLVTHYWSHRAFLGPHELEDGMHRLAGIPGLLAHGRLDVSSPLEVPWRLHRAWPGSEMVVLEDGHGGAGFGAGLRAATDTLAQKAA